MRERQAFREIDGDARKQLELPLAKLRHSELKLIVAALVNDHEVRWYSERFFRVLLNANQSPEYEYVPGWVEMLGKSFVPTGVMVIISPLEAQKNKQFLMGLYNAFQGAGIEFKVLERPEFGDGRVAIGVGYNPVLMKPPV